MIKKSKKNFLKIKKKILKIKIKKLLNKKKNIKSLIKKCKSLMKKNKSPLFNFFNKKKLDYKNTFSLIKYIDFNYKMLPAIKNNVSLLNQRIIKLYIKYSRFLSLLPYLFIHKI